MPRGKPIVGPKPWDIEGISKEAWYKRQRQAKAKAADNPKFGNSTLWMKTENTIPERIAAARQELGLGPDPSLDEIEAACAANIRTRHDPTTHDRIRAYAQFLKDHHHLWGKTEQQNALVKSQPIEAAALVDAEPISATITLTEYRQWQEAWDHFNEHLFDGQVPAKVIVVLLRKASMRGHFAESRYMHRVEQQIFIAEVAMNPDHFIDRDDRGILSTYVHEMVHCWQHMRGSPARRGYHNKEWAAKMKAIGLQPSTTGGVGGKETGQSVSHYIIPGGSFARVCDELLATGFRLNWQSTPHSNERKPPSSKTKFTCMRCAQNVWGKPETEVVCGICYDEDRTIQRMLPPKDIEEGERDYIESAQAA
jgi:hypothetical protein